MDVRPRPSRTSRIDHNVRPRSRTIPIKQRLGIRCPRPPPISLARGFETRKRRRNEADYREGKENRTSNSKVSVKERLGPPYKRMRTSESDETRSITFSSAMEFVIKAQQLKYEEKEKEYDSAMQNIVIWREMFVEADERNNKLQDELDKAKSALKCHKTSTTEIDSLNFQLRKQDKLLGGMDKAILDFQAKVDILERANVNLKQEAIQCNKLLTNATKLKNQNDSKFEAIQAKFVQLEKEKVEAEKYFETKLNEKTQIERVLNKEKALNAQLSSTLTQNEAKLVEITKTSSSKMEEFEKMLVQNKKLQQSNLSFLNAKTQINEELKLKENEIIQLKISQEDEFGKLYDEFDASLTEKKKNIENLNNKITELESTLTDNQSVFDECKNKLGRTKSELTIKMFKTGVQRIVLEIKLQKSNKINSKLETDLFKALEDKNNIKAELDALKQQQAETQAKLKNFTEPLADFEPEFCDGDSEETILNQPKENVSDSLSQIEIFEKESRKLKSKIKKLDKSIKIKASELDWTKNNLAKKTEALNNTNNKCNGLNKENKKMKSQLQEYQHVTDPDRILRIIEQLQQKHWNVEKQRSFVQRKFCVKQPIEVDDSNFIVDG